MKRKILISIFILSVLVLLTSINAYCTDDDRSYYMSSFDITAQLDGKGDLKVLEKITYEFDGTFHGVYRTLKTAGSTGII
ncbi:MAG: DUF2207 domain-containing protein, partial [Pseudomonadota bacterium]